MPRRKYPSGSEKRKKKQRIEKLIKSQEGDINKFFRSKNLTESSGPSVIVEDDEDMEHEDSSDKEDENFVNEEVIHDLNENDNANVSNENRNDLNEEGALLDIYDPSNWNEVDQNFRDLMVERGPLKRGEHVDYPRDGANRHFASTHYTRLLPNGEKQDRRWLVYSKVVDKIFCFCCKLFKEERNISQLATEGFKDWRNVGKRIKSHETSNDHIICMSKWIELEKRLDKNKTIDNSVQEQITKEKEHWRAVLLRILAVVKRLAKDNLAFRGDNEKIYQERNGNFLSSIEMIAEFDAVL
ncbi:hypothetical protein RHGRI_015049 [Rhododendron griersonianum]|uniref:TTF-type domain-containing protein n=1 Tax=Rhododendron griersonianum TaxID=479676 RepID=A0AAV6KBU9_9ERIC|nr:hypothetical protein RHGRI_015049 [Rhododendron griersonianum]